MALLRTALIAGSPARWAALVGLTTGLHTAAFLVVLPEGDPAPGASSGRGPVAVRFADPEPLQVPESAECQAAETRQAPPEAIVVSCTLGAPEASLPPAAAAPPPPPPAPLRTPALEPCRETPASRAVAAAGRAGAADPGGSPLDVEPFLSTADDSNHVLCGGARGGPRSGVGGQAGGVPGGVPGGQVGGVPGGQLGGVLGGVPGGVLGGVVGGVPGGVLGGQGVEAELRLPGKPVYPLSCRRGECHGVPCEGVSRWRVTVPSAGARPSKVDLLASAGCSRLDESVRSYLSQVCVPRAGIFILRIRFELTDAR
jgi:hypothetical protein